MADEKPQCELTFRVDRFFIPTCRTCDWESLTRFERKRDAHVEFAHHVQRRASRERYERRYDDDPATAELVDRLTGALV